jgi:hypothetical protein
MITKQRFAARGLLICTRNFKSFFPVCDDRTRHSFLPKSPFVITTSTPRPPYEGVPKSFRTESITKYTLTFGVTRREATQRVVVAKLTRLIRKIAIQLHLVADSCTICSSRSRRSVRELLDTPSYNLTLHNLCS